MHGGGHPDRADIVRGTRDHTTANQRRYFNWMRKRNRYDLPLSAGVDAQGWAAGMRHFVDARLPPHRVEDLSTARSASRSSAFARRTCRSGSTVSRGNHAWILNGFNANADPAAHRSSE